MNEAYDYCWEQVEDTGRAGEEAANDTGEVEHCEEDDPEDCELKYGIILL